MFSERGSIVGVMDPWPTSGSEWARSTTHRPFCPVVMVAEENQVPGTVVRTDTQYSVLGFGFWYLFDAKRRAPHLTPPGFGGL